MFVRRAVPKRGIVIPYVSDIDTNTVSDIYSRLLNDRIVCLHGPVDTRSASLVVAQLLHLSAASPTRPIRLYLNTTGGSVDDGLAIYDTMQYIAAPVQTVCMGMAASMGSLLLAGGAPGMRVALPNARVMIHQPLVGAINGQASDVVIRTREMVRVRDLIVGLYVKHTGRGRDEVERAIDRDNYMTPHQAAVFGLIDRIIDRVADAKKETAAGGDDKAGKLEN